MLMEEMATAVAILVEEVVVQRQWQMAGEVTVLILALLELFAVEVVGVLLPEVAPPRLLCLIREMGFGVRSLR